MKCFHVNFLSSFMCVFKLCLSLFKNITRTKKHLKNEQRSRDAAAQKRANTSGVGKSNNYYEDIIASQYCLLIVI